MERLTKRGTRENGYVSAIGSGLGYGVCFGTARGSLRLPYDDYGKTWLAYRRKPEEGTTWQP